MTTDKLPNFDKQEHELKSDLDKWFYLLKNLSRLDKIPDFLDKRVFQKIFKIAEVSKLTKEQRELYESDIKAKSDWNGGMNWAKKQAAEKAAKESAQRTTLEIAASLKEKGVSVELIAAATGLSVEEI